MGARNLASLSRDTERASGRARAKVASHAGYLIDCVNQLICVALAERARTAAGRPGCARRPAVMMRRRRRPSAGPSGRQPPATAKGADDERAEELAPATIAGRVAPPLAGRGRVAGRRSGRPLGAAPKRARVTQHARDRKQIPRRTDKRPAGRELAKMNSTAGSARRRPTRMTSCPPAGRLHRAHDNADEMQSEIEVGETISGAAGAIGLVARARARPR
jgi:hypothetical protein